jgi:hypothetical protein
LKTQTPFFLGGLGGLGGQPWPPLFMPPSRGAFQSLLVELAWEEPPRGMGRDGHFTAQNTLPLPPSTLKASALNGPFLQSSCE